MNSEDIPDAVNLWKSLRSLLKVKIEVASPELIHRRVFGGSGGQFECVVATVTVSNEARKDPEWPSIVFMGVGLTAKIAQDSPPDFNEWYQRMERVGPEDSPARHPDSGKGVRRIHGRAFMPITPNEEGYGDSLFPGQMVVYKVPIPLELVDGISFQVEGGVSPRHFFRFTETLPVN